MIVVPNYPPYVLAQRLLQPAEQFLRSMSPIPMASSMTNTQIAIVAARRPDCLPGAVRVRRGGVVIEFSSSL